MTNEELLTSLAETLDWANELVAGVSGDQLALATPCSEWNVRDLLNHMFGGNVMYAMATEGLEPDVEHLHRDLLGGEPEAAYRASADRALAGWRSLDLTSTITLPYGPMPATFSLRTHLMDHMVHGWDLAVATGQPRQAPGHLVALAQQIVDELPDALASNPKVFARSRPAPPGAPGFERLAAACGRQLPG